MNYSDYLQTPHWMALREKYILHNPRARCFVSGIRHALVLHHIRYDHLGTERLGRDLVILTWDIHENKAHCCFFGMISLPLVPQALLRRVMWLRAEHEIMRGNIVLALWFLFRTMVGPFPS